jgi:predicted ATP-binding protein involved in virulence
MRIKQISVGKLFGIFDHVIPLNMDERITIVHGPNGFGKTAILRILNGFFNSRYSELRTIPFENFSIEFDDSRRVEIIQTAENLEGTEKNHITFDFYQPNSDKVSFSPKRIKIKSSVDFLASSLENIIPGLEQVDNERWAYIPTREILSFEEVVNRFQSFLPSFLNSQKEPEWLVQLKGRIHIRLIESQRLLNFVPSRSSIIYSRTSAISPTVSAYSDEIADLMADKFTEYGKISQALDRTFPVRVVQQQSAIDLKGEQLRDQLDELETTRSRLIEVGLLDKDESADFQIQTQTIDKNTKNILSVYVKDVEKKLSVFDEIANKINLLRRLINNKFSYSHKEINFSKEKGFVFTIGDSTSAFAGLRSQDILSPTDLSSGEQHELVLLYELLFKVQANSLVLIDEPELSLHVGWQVQFLKDLQEIIKLADLDIMMATHSPDIIQDRWDLTVALKGIEK